MVSELTEVLTIGELLARDGGSVKTGPFGTTLKASEYSSEGVPLISVREVGYGNFHIDEKTPRVSEATTSRLSEYLLRDGDIVFARKGSVDRCALVTRHQEGWFLGSDGIRLRPPASVNPRFLLYWFLSPLSKDWLNQQATGSTMASLNQAILGRVPLLLPTLEGQTRIAEALGSLDNKISLLRETNVTLEAIAQALFKSWFVDFDPVRAKAEGRDPEGVPPEAEDLFPSEFEETELGPIPKGWLVQTFLDHFEVVRGLSYKGSGLTDAEDPEGVPMHNLNSVLEGGGYKYAGLKHYKGEFKKKHEIRGGDLIVANTEQGHKHLLIGYPAIVPTRVGKVGVFSHHLYCVRPLATSPIQAQFAYRLLLTPSVREQVVGCSNGTTVNMLKADGLSMPRFVCPPVGLSQSYADLAEGIQAKVERNVEQVECLSSLRDTLLPRLMSGRLSIPEPNGVSE